MWRHGGHVGVKNNSEKKSWEFDNFSDMLPLFCTPTWWVSENQELSILSGSKTSWGHHTTIFYAMNFAAPKALNYIKREIEKQEI